MAYFKNVGQKISHNSTIPSLGIGNKDLRPLQDLITAEKSIVNSLVRLSTDITRATDCLKVWGQGEGDDLGDVLNGCHKLLIRLASSISRYATHEQAIRDHMKSVRNREEHLDDLKQRRKKVASQADTADKKLNKMSPEHKNLQSQTELLMSFREQTRDLDAEILAEEAALGNLKREVTRNFMTLKFGGLQELCERGHIIADFGKLIVAEIPQDHVQPGQPRPYYLGHTQVEAYDKDAEAALSNIVFHGEPPLGRPGNRIHIDVQGDTSYTNGSELGMLSPMSGRQAQTLGSSPGGYRDARDGQYSTMPSRLDTAVSPGLGDPGHDSSFSADVERGLSAHRQSVDHGPDSSFAQPPPPQQDYSPPSGPPPGAAVPQMPNESMYGGHDPGYGPEDYEQGGGLAYMNERRQSRAPEGMSSSPQRTNEVSRVPVPAVDPQPVEDDDRTDESALNAAAAREVAREMDQLSFSPPYQPPRLPTPEPQPQSGYGTPSSPFSRRRESMLPTRNPVEPAPPYSPIPTTTEPPPTAAPAPLPSTYLPMERERQSGTPTPNSPTLRTASPPAAVPPPGPPPVAYQSTTSPYRSTTDLPSIGSNISLNSLNRSAVSPGPLPPPGVRTISAAAFRRPQRTVSDATSVPSSPTLAQLPTADTSPLHLRKRPDPPMQSPGAGGRSGFSTVSSHAGQSPQHSPHEEENFDYISAYLGNDHGGEGRKEDFR